MSQGDLHARRLDAVRAWTAFVESAGGAPESGVRPEILSSWARSEAMVTHRPVRGLRRN